MFSPLTGAPFPPALSSAARNHDSSFSEWCPRAPLPAAVLVCILSPALAPGPVPRPPPLLADHFPNTRNSWAVLQTAAML